MIAGRRNKLWRIDFVLNSTYSVLFSVEVEAKDRMNAVNAAISKVYRQTPDTEEIHKTLKLNGLEFKDFDKVATCLKIIE